MVLTFLGQNGANGLCGDGVMETGELCGKYYRVGKEVLVGQTQYSMGDCTYLSDGHGNVTQMTVKSVEEFNPTGAYIAKYEYDAYGNQGINWNASDNPFQYCGEYTDAETGMTYLRARYYDPSIGRFISEDLVKDGMNWYTYCNNDSVNFINSSSLETVLSNMFCLFDSNRHSSLQVNHLKPFLYRRF